MFQVRSIVTSLMRACSRNTCSYLLGPRTLPEVLGESAVGVISVLLAFSRSGHIGRKMVFFFFFGGVTQEVQTVLKSDAEICPLCKSPASLVEYDNVLRLFFVPVWKWSGDNPAVKCTSCPFLMPLNKFNNLRRNRTGPVEQGDWKPAAVKMQCWSCLSPLDSANFKFCPYCGASL